MRRPAPPPSARRERLDRFAASCALALARDRRALFLDPLVGGRWGPLLVARRDPDGAAVLARAASLARAEAVLVASVERSEGVEVVVATLLPDWEQRTLRSSGERLVLDLLTTDELRAVARALGALATLRRSAPSANEGGAGERGGC